MDALENWAQYVPPETLRARVPLSSGGVGPRDDRLRIVPRIEIGVGAVIAAVAGLGWASFAPVNVSLLILGIFLIAHGTYDVYYKPNVRLDKTLTRWLERRYWRVTPEQNAPGDKFYFAIWAEDEAKRRVMISREKLAKGILAFTAAIELDSATVRGIGTKLSTSHQQQLYEELHVLLDSMHLGYNTGVFTNMAVQHALRIDEHLSEHAVDLKATEVVDGVAAARSMIRKAVT